MAGPDSGSVLQSNFSRRGAGIFFIWLCIACLARYQRHTPLRQLD